MLDFMPCNANSTGKFCGADICAKMAVGLAQIEAQQKFSYGYFCYAFLFNTTFTFLLKSKRPIPISKKAK
jgi:hypothetical protein